MTITLENLLYICGTAGIILISKYIGPFIKWLVSLFQNKSDKSSNTNNTNVIVNNGKTDGVYSKEDMIYNAVRDLQVSVKEISHDLTSFKDETNKHFTYIDNRINEVQTEAILEGLNRYEEIKNETEQKMFIDSLRLGEEAADKLKEYTTKINCTHIFIGSFHNGTSSLTGVPYFKFDIIKEEFHPTDIQENDHPFEPVYRNNQLSLYGKLPLSLINEKMLYFNLDDEKSKSIMSKLDTVIMNRMIGMQIKQIALHVTYDNNLISGFVGCVKYDNDPIDLEQFKICVKEMELIYSKNKHLYTR